MRRRYCSCRIGRSTAEVKLQHPPSQHHRPRLRPVPGNRIYPISLRAKLLIGFSIVFSVVFAGAFYWFYSFASEKAINRLRADMLNTLKGAIVGVDVDELVALYEEGEPNAAGFSDDPRYQNQLVWFETVHKIEPRVWLYSYRVDLAKNNRRVGPTAVLPEELEIVYLVDLWSAYDPSKAARFLESDRAGMAAHSVYRKDHIFESTEIYEDKWGTWLSASAPLKDKNGRTVAVIGVDIQADYVIQVQQAIRDRVLGSFVITYGILFILIYVLSGILTQRLSKLTYCAEQIGSGDYGLDLSTLTQSLVPDELNTLAKVFESMVASIRIREQLIREGKRTEDEMRLALQEERELNELKSRFVSMVSHELRTPLTVMRTSLELLERYGHMASPEKKQEYFLRSRTAIETMAQLIDDVLTMGKAEAGKLEFNPSPLDLEEFCQTLINDLKMGGKSRQLIRFQAQGDCQNAYLDAALLRSILTNLLSNAIKYSPEGSAIDFTLSCQDGSTIFEVSDRGIGIPLEDQPRLFELFHRASNAGTIRGTGLGLAIVKQCVAHHRGQVSFNSQEGIGTTFTVKLPLRSLREDQDNSDDQD